jgi:hypothetical protein
LALAWVGEDCGAGLAHEAARDIQSRHPRNDNGGSFTRPSGTPLAELSNPVSPAEDRRDASFNSLPHVEFTGNAICEFLPSLSRGNGVPTPTPQAEYTTVELNYGAGKTFETALAGEQSKLQGETLWYRLVEGGTAPRYVRLRPRATLANILDSVTR